MRILLPFFSLDMQQLRNEKKEDDHKEIRHDHKGELM